MAVEEILCALWEPAAVCLAVTLLALTTETDFTTCGDTLDILLIILIIFGIITMFVQSKGMSKIVGGLGAIVTSVCLAHDIQQLTGGKTIEIHPIGHIGYILSVTQICWDVLQLFFFVLIGTRN